uniref:Uncharacterized protein n=1 Tax=viral metagenome TaxID=1070528 RepID=A0A6C0ID47_9ZZZZ
MTSKLQIHNNSYTNKNIETNNKEINKFLFHMNQTNSKFLKPHIVNYNISLSNNNINKYSNQQNNLYFLQQNDLYNLQYYRNCGWC